MSSQCRIKGKTVMVLKKKSRGMYNYLSPDD